MHPDGGGEVGGAASGIDLGDQGGDRQTPARRQNAQAFPERMFEGHAGPMTGDQ